MYWTKERWDNSSWKERLESSMKSIAYERRGKFPRIYRNAGAMKVIVDDILEEIGKYDDVHYQEVIDIFTRHLEKAERFPKTILMRVKNEQESCDS